MSDGARLAAAARAVALVADGMRLGLGTGRAAGHVIRLLGLRVRDEGLRITCVATSRQSEALARAAGLALEDGAGPIDLAIDGADQIERATLRLVKGGGGALLREKIVAAASDRMIVIADESKWVQTLGRFPLPIEVIPFGLGATRRAIEAVFAENGVSGEMDIRKAKDGHAFVTDGGHWIIDARLGRIPDSPRLAASLNSIPGVVEHGLFIGLARTVVLAGPQGIRVIERPLGRN